ncbi:hypothetical protein BD310DRAFT_916548 [Dichomitus squalens]|uniref:Uncharacterized protein n=1 Tax=Dichomitus squalens TaxID=114155 RepID=A0A4Q9Q7K1_9APHY|nr:hypothetical protein BD310DRAFT_916548 [Dichomitus squalens]
MLPNFETCYLVFPYYYVVPLSVVFKPYSLGVLVLRFRRSPSSSTCSPHLSSFFPAFAPNDSRRVYFKSLA